METGFRGTKTLQTFSPRWTDDELLEKTLAGRRELVDRFEALARDGAGGPNKHQRLIIGVRGSGKTHVLKVLHNRLWRDEPLKERLLIVYLLEDELGVASFLDFLVRMLRAIFHWYPEHGALNGELNALYDLPAAMQPRRAVDLLLSTAGTKDVLILMENLGLMFDKTRGFGKKGQQALRDLVQQYPRFMIFATAQALTQGVSDSGYPFFGFFKITHLARLTQEEALNFLSSIASATRRQDLVAFLKTPEGRGRVKAIYQFTGGNHRLLVAFFNLLSGDSVAKLSELFLHELNPLRPFYQEQMRSLSAQQQKIVQYLADSCVPQPVKKIARGCLAAQNTVSSQLKDLLDKNFVSRIEQGRESYYEITESLFRICHEADLEQEGAPVRLFVDFLASFYTAQELRRRFRGFQVLADTALPTGATAFAEEARFYRHALSRYEGTQAVLPPHEDVHSFFFDLSKQYAHRDVIEFAHHLGAGRDAFILVREALAYADLGKSEAAADTACEALRKSPDDVDAHALLADLWADRSDHRETALAHARRVCELAPDNWRGWFWCATILDFMGRDEEALAACEKALSVAPDDVEIRGMSVGLLVKTGHFAEALKRLEEVLQVRPESSQTCLLSALAVEGLGRVDEAEAHYRKALALDPDNATALERLGCLLGNAGRHAEAVGQFETLLGLKPEASNAWRLSALALEELGRLDGAEERYRKALALDPANAAALERLGILLGKAGRHAEALEQFEALLRLKPEESEAWRLSAVAFHELGRLDPAEECYRKALALDGNNANALEGLGALLVGEGRHGEALEQFELLNRLAESPEARLLLAVALQTLGRQEEAEAQYRRSLMLEPGNVLALEGIGRLFLSAARYLEATECLERLIKQQPDDAEGWRLSATALRMIGRNEQAAEQYRKALGLDPTDGPTRSRFADALEASGHIDEAIRVATEGLQVAKNPVDLYNTRGEIRRRMGQFEAALADYEAAIELDPEKVDVHFNIVTAMIALGRTTEAPSVLARALEAHQRGSHADQGLLVVCFEENLTTLFRYAAEGTFRGFLSHAVDLAHRTGVLAEFEKALGTTLFALLRDHAAIEESRYRSIESALRESLEGRIDISVILRLLDTGIRFFKRNDRKALLNLPNEERALFRGELGIADPPG